LADRAPGLCLEPVTPGAVTPARAKFKDSALVELNPAWVWPLFYGVEAWVQRWHGHRLLGHDSSLCRRPHREPLGKVLSGNEVPHQTGATGTRYPEGRISVLYEVRNRVGLDARLEPSRIGEVTLALDQ
jgi:hypothetical protein